LTESLALGTPFISTDCPSGPRKILAGSRYGMPVPAGGDRTLAEAIIPIMKNPLPADGLKKAVKEYSLKNSVKGYLKSLNLGYHGVGRVIIPIKWVQVGHRPFQERELFFPEVVHKPSDLPPSHFVRIGVGGIARPQDILIKLIFGLHFLHILKFCEFYRLHCEVFVNSIKPDMLQSFLSMPSSLLALFHPSEVL